MSDNDRDNLSDPDEYRKRAEEERIKRVREFADSLLREASEADEPTEAYSAPEPDMPEPDIHELIRGLKEIIERDDHTGHRKRLRDKLDEADLDNVPSDELLEAFLSYLIPRKDVAPLAEKLLDHYGSLWKVFCASPGELVAFPSMTESAARVMSHAMRLVRDSSRKTSSIRSSEQALKYFAEINVCDECIKTHVAYLDADFNIIEIETHSGERAVDPAIIVGSAYRLAASYVIVGRRDSELFPQWHGGAAYAAKLRELLDTVDALLLDIIVFTGLGYYSLGSSAVRKNAPIVYVFTPLITMPDVGELVRELTPDGE